VEDEAEAEVARPSRPLRPFSYRGEVLAGAHPRLHYRGLSCPWSRLEWPNSGCSFVRLKCSLLVSLQIRWKTSVPRMTPPPGPVATHRATMVVGLTKRPNQTTSMLQSEVQFLEVWNLTRRPRTPPVIS
jgi:hypothetical protein